MQIPQEALQVFFWKQIQEPFTITDMLSYYEKLFRGDDEDTEQFYDFMEDYYANNRTMLLH